MKNNLKTAALLAALFLPACSYNVQNKENLETVKASIAPSNLNISTEKIDALDHVATTPSIICSAHTFNIPLAAQLSNSLEALDKDGSLDNAPADVVVTGQAAQSTFKCIQTSVVSGKCEGKVDATVLIKDKSGREKSFNTSQSSIRTTTGCEGVTGSLEEAGAKATQDIINQIRSYD